MRTITGIFASRDTAASQTWARLGRRAAPARPRRCVTFSNLSRNYVPRTFFTWPIFF
jgi:hypothetical protein